MEAFWFCVIGIGLLLLSALCGIFGWVQRTDRMAPANAADLLRDRAGEQELRWQEDIEF